MYSNIYIYVWFLIAVNIGSLEPLLTAVKRRKWTWLGHVCKHDVHTVDIASTRLYPAGHHGGQTSP